MTVAESEAKVAKLRLLLTEAIKELQAEIVAVLPVKSGDVVLYRGEEVLVRPIRFVGTSYCEVYMSKRRKDGKWSAVQKFVSLRDLDPKP